MAHNEELSDFQHGNVIECHLSNKSVHQISALLELPRSTVNAVIVKWKHPGATSAQPRSGRPHQLTEGDHRVLKHVTWKNRLSSVATLTTEFQTDSGSNISTSTVHRELHEMGFHGRAAAQKPRSPCATTSVGWSGVMLTTIGLWSSGNMFSGMMNHASPSGSPTAESGFGECQNATYPNAMCQL